MKVDPCNVCGSTEVNLVDGFYYCVECGTQDVNVRETVVEQKALADGTFAASSRRKIVTTANKGNEMSSEWYRWHAFNFVLEGLAEDLVALGADPSFKIKLLWIWSRYVKMYQNKDKKSYLKDSNESATLQSLIVFEDTPTSAEEPKTTGKKKKHKSETFRRDINFMTKGVMVSMLYLALNLDRSHIQLSHLYRFLKEGRIIFSNINKYIPSDINLKVVQQWTGFIQARLCGPHAARATSMTMLKKLDLGVPIIPDMKQIVTNFMTELCLPKEMRDLVFSLMQFFPLDYLDVTNRDIVGSIRVPDYEAVAMSYVLVALKMCFGLDDDYEIKLSDVVENINERNGWGKSYKIGIPELTKRMFSFREWCYFLRARKIMLRKHCLFMAEQNCLDLDDHVFMEHLVERTKTKVELMDEIAMDLLNKIPLEPVRVIPKEEFTSTVTPMVTYTQVILDHCQDPEIRLLLSEDFSQYSLKYACEDLELIDTNTSKNIVEGVSKCNKVKNHSIEGVLKTKKSDVKMVYVKNCENKNWLKTNPPTMEHVTKVPLEGEREGSRDDKESDHGYASNSENSNDGENKVPEKVFMIKEEDENRNIFDDSFEDLEKTTEYEHPNENTNLEAITEDNHIAYNAQDDDDNSRQSSDNEGLNDWNRSLEFNPDTFDREKIKKELILIACKKYKIPIPKDYKPNGAIKRKINTTNNEEGPSSAKRQRVVKTGETRKEVERLIATYHEHMERDILRKISEQVKTVIQNCNRSQENVETDQIPESMPDNHLSFNETNPNDVSEISRIDGTQNNIDLDNLENTDATGANPESTLFDDEDSDEESEEEISKSDPKFDESKYDVNQLYIKVEEDREDCFEVNDDPVIEEILARKIKENKKSKEVLKQQPKPVEVVDMSDSDDDIPLKDLQLEKRYLERKFTHREHLGPLVKGVDTKFRYWLRHYTSRRMVKSLDMHEKFEIELEKNCPKSFYFVIRECASVLNCSTFYLYKNMQSLEQSLVARAKYDDM